MPVVTVKYLTVFSNLTGLSCLRGLKFKVYGAEAEVRGIQGGVAVERRLKPREARR
jgi:hypothetical protein